MWGHVVSVRDLQAGVSYRARLLLYALAARADRSGACRPSIDQLVSDTGMSRRGVMRARDELVDAGLVLQVGGSYAGFSNRYRLAVDNSAAEARPVDNSASRRAGGSARLAREGCQPGTGGVPTWHPKRK